jgi:hypothetical protein
MPPLLIKLIFDKVEQSPMPFFASRSLGRLSAGSTTHLLTLKLPGTSISWRQS